MRAYLAAISLLFLTMVSMPAHAQGIGNPVLSSYDFVVQGTVEYATTDIDLDADRQEDEEAELTTTLFKGILGVHPRLDLFFQVGTVSVDLCEGDAQEVCGEDGELDGVDDIAYGGGVRWTFWDGDKVEAAVGFSALLFNVSDEVENTDVELDWVEYELFTGASFPAVPYLTPYVIPYVGVTYNVVDAEFDGPNTIDMEEDDSFGAFAGIDIPWTDYFSFTLEGRFGSRDTLSFGLNARY